MIWCYSAFSFKSNKLLEIWIISAITLLLIKKKLHMHMCKKEEEKKWINKFIKVNEMAYKAHMYLNENICIHAFL